MREYFTNTIQHDKILPHNNAPQKSSKRHVQPLQKPQRSASTVRLNDTNRSQFTIGHADCLFSQHEVIRRQAHHAPANLGNERSRSAMELNRGGRLDCGYVDEKSLTRRSPITAANTNLITPSPVTQSPFSLVDQQRAQRELYMREAAASSQSHTYKQLRKESETHQVCDGPNSQPFYASQGRTVYDNQHGIFKAI